MFIVFDGVDGAGKSTQLSLIAEWLEVENIPFIQSREPGGCVNAEKIRDLFVSYKMEPISQLLLLSAARFEHLQSLKNENRLILCDRFVDSTYAYQGLFLDDSVIDSIVSKTVFKYPDYVFLFLHHYTNKQENYLDDLSNARLSSLIKKFKARIQSNYIVIPEGSIEEQHEFIKSHFKGFLNIV